MRNRWLSIALVSLVIAVGRQTLVAQQPGSPSPSPARREPLVVSGKVTAIHAPRLLTVRETDGDRELVVLAPRALSPAVVVGTTIRVEGAIRRIDFAELMKSAGVRDMDASTRRRLAGSRVLVATSVLASAEGEAPEEPENVANQPPPPAHARPTSPSPLTIRVSTLLAHLDGFAGQQVRVLNARVVGLLEPGAFLVEPATDYLKSMGMRDRIVVLIQGGALRVPADLLVGSTVMLEGVPRTLVGIRVTGEAPWPERLTRDALERLEVRAALLATSVKTAEGTELTDRPQDTSGS